MKHLILGFTCLLFAFVTAAQAQAQADWRALLTMSGSKVVAVEGAMRIDIGTARALHDRGVTFVDTRGSSDWRKGHIPGALDLAYPSKAELMEVLDMDEEVVFYCDCDVGSASCNRSPNASAMAVNWGYQHVYYFTNSHEWGRAGHPIETAE